MHSSHLSSPSAKSNFKEGPRFCRLWLLKEDCQMFSLPQRGKRDSGTGTCQHCPLAGWWTQSALLVGFFFFFKANSYCCPLHSFCCCAVDPGINFRWKCCRNKKVMPLPALFQKVFKWKKVFSIFNKHLQYYWVGFFVHITRLIMLSDTFKACLTKIQWYNGLLCSAFFLHSNHNQH